MKPLQMILTIALFSIVFMGCNKGGEVKTGNGDKTYDIKAKVVSLDTAKKTITLDHEDIPGLMKAMTMPYDVENAKVLEGFKAGDQVHGKLKANDGKYIILELHKQ